MEKKVFARRYTGPLDARQASAGIAAASQTALGLLRDAELLLENERWQGAAALSILAIEEAGKVAILRSILLARNNEELKLEWQSYRRHTSKNASWMFVDLFREGARKLEDFRSLFENSDHARFLDDLKQACFYSDVAEHCAWLTPQQQVGRELAKSIFATAATLVPLGPSAMQTEAELELWIKHLRPVWKGPMVEMKKALAACYAEAEEKGLLQRGSSMGMLDFIFGITNPLEQ